MQINGKHFREAATIAAVAVTLWATMPQLVVWLFFAMHPIAALLFHPDTTAFRWLFQVLMLVGFFGLLSVIAVAYRKLFQVFTLVRRPELPDEPACR